MGMPRLEGIAVFHQQLGATPGECLHLPQRVGEGLHGRGRGGLGRGGRMHLDGQYSLSAEVVVEAGNSVGGTPDKRERRLSSRLVR